MSVFFFLAKLSYHFIYMCNSGEDFLCETCCLHIESFVTLSNNNHMNVYKKKQWPCGGLSWIYTSVSSLHCSCRKWPMPIMSICTSVLLSLCKYSAKLLVGGEVYMLLCGVSCRCSPLDLDGAGADTYWSAVRFTEFTATQKQKKRLDEMVYMVAEKREKPGMRCYQADQSKFLWSTSWGCVITFFGGCVIGYGVGWMQKHKLTFINPLQKRESRLFLLRRLRSSVVAISSVVASALLADRGGSLGLWHQVPEVTSLK